MPLSFPANVDWILAGVRVPVRLARPAGPPRGAVLLLHGLGARKEVQDEEARALAAAGLLVVTPDAPHHGARRSPRLDAVIAASGPEAHELFLSIVREAVAELPQLVDRLLADGLPSVAVAGISMGAYVALAAAVEDVRLAPVVSILGSPDWSPRAGEPTGRARAWMDEAPLRRAERLAPRPLLLAVAGLDENVPPAGARALAEALRPRYVDHPGRLQLLEYPQSRHHMREEDWRDLMGRVVAFVT